MFWYFNFKTKITKRSIKSSLLQQYNTLLKNVNEIRRENKQFKTFSVRKRTQSLSILPQSPETEASNKIYGKQDFRRSVSENLNMRDDTDVERILSELLNSFKSFEQFIMSTIFRGICMNRDIFCDNFVNTKEVMKRTEQELRYYFDLIKSIKIGFNPNY